MKSKKYSDRIKAVFQSQKVDAIIIEKPVDLFYLTSLELSAGALLISHQKPRLLVDGRYLAAAKDVQGYECILASPKNLQKELQRFSRVGFDSSFTSFSRWKELEALVSKKKLTPLKKVTAATRAIKDKAELIALKKSATLLWKGFEFLKKKIKVGITEKELGAYFKIFCLQEGAEAFAFEPIIAFGKNSAFPHYRCGNAALKKGDIILVDIGVVVDHYHSDMTRTFFFGTPDPKLALFETVVKKAHAAALAECKPGVKVGKVDLAARKVIEKAGLTSYLAHSLGHGVGLEIHEFPRIKYQGEDHDVILQEGMVITIEPGLYHPGVGGFRYEDTITITSRGYENWYPS